MIKCFAVATPLSLALWGLIGVVALNLVNHIGA
jgi:uncharacterized membrane protein YuzA (DUF378 family)